MKTLLILILTSFLIHANCLTKKDDIAVGECYEKEGNINLAQAAYERALIEDGDNTQARIRLAQLYQNLAMRSEANTLLTDVNKNQLTPAQRTSLETLQPTKSSEPEFKAKATLSGGYDSNINISPEDLPSNPSLEATDTLFSRFNADLSYLHAFDSKQSWFFRGDLNFHYQNNEAAHYYDALYARLYTGLGYQNNNFSIYVPLFYDQLHYLDRDLLEEYGIRPDINIRLSNNTIFNLNMTYTARRYLNIIDTLRDDDLISAGLGLYYLENNNIAYVKTRYESYSATHNTTPAFIDKTMLYFMLGGVYTLDQLLDLRLDYQYRYGDFSQYLSTKRDDSNHDIAISAEKDITSSFRLSAKYHYINNDSNLANFDYNKHEMLLALTFNY